MYAELFLAVFSLAGKMFVVFLWGLAENGPKPVYINPAGDTRRYRRDRKFN